jgi:hypothetical protein
MRGSSPRKTIFAHSVDAGSLISGLYPDRASAPSIIVTAFARP